MREADVVTERDVASLAEQAAPAHAIGPYLAAELGDDSWRDCQVRLVSGGKSNLTFYVASAAGEVVLRRPPLSTVLPTAHDMRREHTVMTALASTDVPVPRTLAPESSVIFWLAACVCSSTLAVPALTSLARMVSLTRRDFGSGLPLPPRVPSGCRYWWTRAIRRPVPSW